MTSQHSYLSPIDVSKISGVSKDTINRWRIQGYIQGHLKEDSGSRRVFLYSPEEVDKIKQVSKLVQKGYAPRKAFERFSKEESLLSDSLCSYSQDPTTPMYTAGNVIDRTKIPREILLRWAQKGHVGKKIKKGKKNVFTYSEDDIEKIEYVFNLTSHGYAPRHAFKKYQEEHANPKPGEAQPREPVEISYSREEIQRDFESLEQHFLAIKQKYKL